MVSKFGRMHVNKLLFQVFLSIKKYHFNGSFENELKEKLLSRYTVVFFPIQSNIFGSLITETRLAIFAIVSIVPIFKRGIYTRSYL